LVHHPFASPFSPVYGYTSREGEGGGGKKAFRGKEGRDSSTIFFLTTSPLGAREGGKGREGKSAQKKEKEKKRRREEKRIWTSLFFFFQPFPIPLASSCSRRERGGEEKKKKGKRGKGNHDLAPSYASLPIPNYSYRSLAPGQEGDKKGRGRAFLHKGERRGGREEREGGKGSSRRAHSSLLTNYHSIPFSTPISAVLLALCLRREEKERDVRLEREKKEGRRGEEKETQAGSGWPLPPFFTHSSLLHGQPPALGKEGKGRRRRFSRGEKRKGKGKDVVCSLLSLHSFININSYPYLFLPLGRRLPERKEEGEELGGRKKKMGQYDLCSYPLPAFLLSLHKEK